MKSTLIILAILFLSNNVQSQEIDVTKKETNNYNQEYERYSSKHKKRKKTGFIMLGSGAALTITGAILISSIYTDDSTDGAILGGGMFVVGAAASLASIPILISAKNNKKKANLALKNGNVSLLYTPIKKPNYLSLSLSIPIGK